MEKARFQEAAQWIRNSGKTTAFTGAGISVESGIPPFRGENGLWNKYDPATFDISYFLKNTRHSWEVMRDIFYDLFGQAGPNAAHYALAELENRGLLNSVITQNVDNLHTDAGSKTVYEFHGSLKKLVCLECSELIPFRREILETLPPRCLKCDGVLKPNAVFFGEGIPEHAYSNALGEAESSELFILIGTIGEVAPANMIPRMAKGYGARIIEINISKSSYTDSVTDIFLQGKATEMMEGIMAALD
ncbi:MAG: NAD-dependent deacylase [Desulfamplus sp.]|nr:NAD-dependent deacylase [Desulfamplus sp.]